MPIRKPVPAVLPWLTALAAAPLVLIVAAVAATRFGGVDLAVSYDLLTWTVDGKVKHNHYISGFPPYDAQQLLSWADRIEHLDEE